MQLGCPNTTSPEGGPHLGPAGWIRAYHYHLAEEVCATMPLLTAMRFQALIAVEEGR